MLLLAPLVLVGPLLLLVEVELALLRLGPVGWVLAAGLLLALGWATRWSWRRTRRWWASTKAPVRTVPSPSRPRPVPPAPRHRR